MSASFLDQILAYIHSGGAVMLPITLVAAVLWFGIGYRFFTIKRGNVRAVRALVDKYRAGYPKAPRGIVDTAVVVGLRESERALPNLRRRLDIAFSGAERQMARFKTTVRATVAAAPLLGLLGTVIGMIETFASLGDMSLFSQSGGIAGGISVALFTTQLGLVVAIPGLLVGRVLDQRQEAIENELIRLKDILCGQQPEEA